MPVPKNIKIYHIVHLDRLPHIIQSGYLYSDAHMQTLQNTGTTIGLQEIKRRRLTHKLDSHPDLHVGECVPFYFCPRSVMLYLIYKKNSQLTYQDGQEPIVHLEADFYETIRWAYSNKKRWSFTTSNAGSSYFDDYSSINDLDKVNWEAVSARYWQDCKEGKQAEFLIEQQFPWTLIKSIGVISTNIQHIVIQLLPQNTYQPDVIIQRNWYY